MTKKERQAKKEERAKKAKRAKRKFTFIVSLILVIILGALVVFGWYYPHYLFSKEKVEVKPDADTICIMSYNVRCLTPLDLFEKSWFYRADLIIDDIEEQKPGIIGFQEATKWQYGYLVDCLKGYDSVITYRDNAFNSEGCPIFYNTELYTLIDKGSFWLSETPEEMSKDWGSACYRICSYVILKENASGKDFVVFNTHLDHVSDEARIKGIDVVLDKIAQFGGLPAVIMGDFNAMEGSVTYNSVTENFLDAKYQTENTSDDPTYQNWGNPDSFRRIDFFMISKTGITVESYDVLTELHDGVHSSDHNSIVLRMTLD